MSDIAIAALLAGTILLASMVSVEIGISVALIELLAGVIVGNSFSLDVPGWLTFIGSFAGILLTFLAGAEVDVPQLRREWRASASIGLVSFFAPFIVVALVAYFGLDWTRRQAEIGGLALSTTSLAVVYAVLVETGLSGELVGKRSVAGYGLRGRGAHPEAGRSALAPTSARARRSPRVGPGSCPQERTRQGRSFEGPAPR
jgi:Kef-type K+ transport system membrane component KefB